MDFFEYISSFPQTALVVWFFVTGSIFGSFANVLIHRTLRLIQKEEESENFSGDLADKDVSPAPEGSPSPKTATGDSQISAENSSFSHSREENSTQNRCEVDSDEFPSMSLKGMVADRMAQHFQMIGLLFSFFVKNLCGPYIAQSFFLERGFFIF